MDDYLVTNVPQDASTAADSSAAVVYGENVTGVDPTPAQAAFATEYQSSTGIKLGSKLVAGVSVDTPDNLPFQTFSPRNRLLIKNWTTLPNTCAVGEVAMLNGAIYECNPANTWIAVTPSDAYIRGLFSGTAPILYNSSTGVFSFGSLSYLSNSYLAGEAISTGNAVCSSYYQTDGGVKVDFVSGAQVAATSVSAALTVANNTNRIMVVVIGFNNGVSISNVQYNGTSLNSIDSTSQGNATINTYYLLAPSTGNNNFTFSISANSQNVSYVVYSLYNAKQSGQPSAHTTTTGASNSDISVNITPAELADFVIGYGGTCPSSGSPIDDDTLTFNGLSGANQQQFLTTASEGLTVANNGQAITTAAQTH